MAGDPPAWSDGLGALDGFEWDGAVGTVAAALAALEDGRVVAARVPGGALPDRLPDGLAVGAVLERREPRDVVATTAGVGILLSDLPEGARVGLTGHRRAALLGLHRPDLRPVAVDGPESARDALRAARLAALVVANRQARHPALAGLELEALDAQAWTPSMGEGVDVLVVRAGAVPSAALAGVDHAPTARALAAERAVVRGLGGGAGRDVGVLAVPYGRWLRLWASVADAVGRRLVRVELSGRQDHPEELGRAAAQSLLDRGAGSLLG